VSLDEDAAGFHDEPARSLDQGHFREVLGRFATGVTVVTAMEDGQPVGFTCQAFTSLSLEPPMVALAPAKTSTSWPRIAQAGAFGVNILASDQEALCRDFAVSGGDKFANVRWRPGRAGTPILDGVLAWLECRLGAIHDAGDHELVIGEVLALGVGRGGPLLFYRGGFGTFEP
jgi:3-hydroxy-9,10-secoandrosta-1,3,5(10)-triene-9,17-dione monooxygenase reductase component